MSILKERNPLDPHHMMSLRHWMDPVGHPDLQVVDSDTVVDCGWGRLIFGQTFSDPRSLVQAICREQPGKRDIALYLRDPHVVVALAPQDLFIDPSYAYRLSLATDVSVRTSEAWRIRPATRQDADAVRRIYQTRKMVPPPRSFFSTALGPQSDVEMLVAECLESGAIVGVVMGVDHVRAFNDPDRGASLWALAVDGQAGHPGVGEGLTRELARLYQLRQRTFLDLSVVHDNHQAIALYERLGFVRVPVYCVKKKNPINEHLFLGPDPASDLNVYAGILVREARRRGIGVDVIDAEGGYFRLTLGGRSIICRESLSELTSAVAMSRCADKRVTLRTLDQSGIAIPAQTDATDLGQVEAFLAHHGRVVVKPAQGEQGQGVRVDLDNMADVLVAIEAARQHCDQVIVEQMVDGEDLRIVVIDHQVVAAAIRRPASIVGDGRLTVRGLIERQSRRRQMATAGESRIPMDDETERCLRRQGYGWNDVLPPGVRLLARKTANLHTGGTIHDVTGVLHPELKAAAERASRALDIPVVGMDFMVSSPDQPAHVVIEANERPGLANHEPQPTAERFIDLLFPQTRASRREITEETSIGH